MVSLSDTASMSKMTYLANEVVDVPHVLVILGSQCDISLLDDLVS